MGFRVARLAGIAIGALATLAAAFPASCRGAAGNGTLTLVFENDCFYQQDRDYTNGIALIWVPPEEPSPAKASGTARWIPWFPAEGLVRHGYAVGQNIYTPSDITVADPPLDERPYAGWLYLTFGYGVETKRQLNQFAVTLGVVGPASLAEESQSAIHHVTDSAVPQGWDTQIGNELGISLTGQRSWRGLISTTLFGLDLDLTLHLGGAIGNVYTYANAGSMLRYGKGLSLDYGPPRIQPSIQGSGFVARSDRPAWYLFAGCEGRAVARNIFLDGNTFQDSRSVDKEPLVGDLQWGIVLTWRGTRLSYIHVIRTREFKGAPPHDDFGAISLSLPL